MTTKATVTHQFQWDEYTVKVYYHEYSGGGTGYEYLVFQGAFMLHQSEDYWGQPEGAAAAALEWIAEQPDHN